MTILDRYILSQFGRNLLLVILAILALYLLVDFFEKVDNFIEAGRSIGLTIRYLLLKIPQIVSQIMPICLMLAAVITLGVINHNRELMALLAGGVSISRIITPLILIATATTLLIIAASEWLLPPTISATNQIWYEQVKHSRARGIKRGGRTFYRGRNGVYSFHQANQQEYFFTDLHYTAWDSNYQLSRIIAASRARWRKGVWSLENGYLKSRESDDKYLTREFQHEEISLPDNPADFFVPEYRTEELSLSEIIRSIYRTPLTRQAEIRRLNRRLSYIFLGIPLVLLGLPVLLLVNRRWNLGLSVAIPASSLMAFAAWGWWNVSQAMITAYGVHPIPASWSIHLIAASAGIILLRREAQSAC